MTDPVEEVYSGRGWVSVYGTGYVGVSLIAVYLRHGLKVIGVDIDEKKLEKIRRGDLWFDEKAIGSAVKKGLEEGKLFLTSDGVEASRRSVIKVITVPIYIDWDTKKIDYSSLEDVSMKIGLGLKRDDLVIVESSVPPGTTRDVVKPILEESSGLKAENDFYLAHSPERVYIGRAVEDIEKNYPKVVGGVGPRSLNIASRFYERIAEKGVISLSSTTAAEFEKLAEGIYRDVNIALANELAVTAMKLGVDYYEAREAANSQPYCHLHLPGPGVGGYCIPVYPYFMMDRVLAKGYIMELTKLARRINESMPYIVVSLVEELRKKTELKPNNAKVVVLGAAFRGNIDDVRLSPTHDTVALLRARGYRDIVVHDPFVKSDPVLEELNIKLTGDLEEALKDSDVVIVATRHDKYKRLKLSEIICLSGKKPLIVDATAFIDIDTNYDKVIILGKTPLY